MMGREMHKEKAKFDKDIGGKMEKGKKEERKERKFRLYTSSSKGSRSMEEPNIRKLAS